MERLAFIMAGGSGERFWPLSRSIRPKQLLKLTSSTETLLEEASNRIAPLVGAENVFVITGKHLEEPIREANVVQGSNVWVEPMKRNTLGALVWVAANLMAIGRDNCTLAILTADHKISDPDEFRKTVAKAMDAAEATQGLVTCGIVPSRAETGYGYVELDRSQVTELGAIRSAGFREKPDAATAEQFLAAGNFLWNSGMFFWTLSAFLRELESAQPATFASLQLIVEALRQGRLDAAESAFSQLPNLSVDFAIMESASSVFVVEASFEWDDVGAWDALPRALPAIDELGNVSLGQVLSIDCRNTVLYNDSKEIRLAAIGIENLVAVVTDDAILLCPIDQAQRVKEIVERLKTEDKQLL